MSKYDYNADEKKDQRRGFIYAISLHIALFLLLLAGLLHAPRSPAPVQIELWAEGDLQIEEDPTDDATELIEDEVENPTPQEPEPLDEPESEPQDQPEPQEPAPTPEPTPEAEPEPAAEPDEPTPAEPEPTETEAVQEPDPSQEQQPTEADLPPVEDPDIALAKAEKERQEREEAERKAREEAERKAKEEAERKEREEAERKAKEEAERKAREEAERKAKEEAARKQAQLREAMQAAGREAAGIEGGTAAQNRAGGGGGDDGYAARVRSCIKPRVVFNTPPRSGNVNPTLQYKVELETDGRVRNVLIVKSSGNRAFDDAVQKGITKCSPFPKPPSGSYPKTIDGAYRMYD